jgi:hypothetical protein
VIPIIQIDKLTVSASLGSKLTHLQNLTVDISVRHSLVIGGQMFPSSPQDLIVMINDLPNLRNLHLSALPCRRLNYFSLPLYPFLQYLRPLALTTLHLHGLCDTSPLLSPFLSSLLCLQSLSLHFTPILEGNNKPWRDMFVSLKYPLSRPTLKTLVLKFDGCNAFELASRYVRTGSTGLDDGSESEDEDEDEDEIEDEENWLPVREEMLDCLAEIMPHYHDQVFRRCVLGYDKIEY